VELREFQVLVIGLRLACAAEEHQGNRRQNQSKAFLRVHEIVLLSGKSLLRNEGRHCPILDGEVLIGDAFDILSAHLGDAVDGAEQVPPIAGDNLEVRQPIREVDVPV
jgi:hypothetical protein